MRLLSLLALLSLVSFSVAEDKKDAKKEEVKKPMGTFVKSAGNFDVTFDFQKDDVFVFKMGDGTNGCTITSKAKYEKDGKVTVTLEKFEKMGEFPFEKEKGYQFSFKYKMNGKKLEISNLEGDDIDEQGKNLVEGDYEEKK